MDAVSRRWLLLQFPGPDEDVDVDELFVALCRHCRVLRAATAVELRDSTDAQRQAARDANRATGEWCIDRKSQLTRSD